MGICRARIGFADPGTDREELFYRTVTGTPWIPESTDWEKMDYFWSFIKCSPVLNGERWRLNTTDPLHPASIMPTRAVFDTDT